AMVRTRAAEIRFRIGADGNMKTLFTKEVNQFTQRGDIGAMAGIARYHEHAADSGSTQLFAGLVTIRNPVCGGVYGHMAATSSRLVNGFFEAIDARHQHFIGARLQQFAGALRTQGFSADVHGDGTPPRAAFCGTRRNVRASCRNAAVSTDTRPGAGLSGHVSVSACAQMLLVSGRDQISLSSLPLAASFVSAERPS